MPQLFEYPVFEADQVLTASNLNDVTDYLTEQDLLTRRKLIGIGIVCGLEVQTEGSSKITITKGVGITSLGYLIHLDTCELGYYGPYIDKATTPYENFLSGTGDQYPLWELNTAQEYVELDDPAMKALGAATEFDLDDMAVILYLEIVDKDLEDCIGEDCLEKGISRIHTVRKLLVSKSDLLKIIQKGMKADEDMTPTDILASLNPECDLPAISLERLSFNLNNFTSLHLHQINSWHKLYNSYDQIIRKGAVRIGNALHKTYTLFETELAIEYGGSNPFDTYDHSSANQNGLYQTARLQYDTDQIQIQYSYDFLKDLILAYNEFVESAVRLHSDCCPDPDLYPLHLMLDAAIPVPDEVSPYRHYFRSSAALDNQSSVREEFIMMHRRIVEMIENFEVRLYEDTDDVLITPSKFECKPLSQRALPFYYTLDSGDPIYNYWSYFLAERCKQSTVLSYNAASYSSLAHVIRPLLFDINSYPYFRVEGHIGQNYIQVKETLKTKIERYNLPLDVVGVKLSRDWVDIEVDKHCFADIQVLYKANRDEFIACLAGLKRLITQIIGIRKVAAKRSEVNMDKTYGKATQNQATYLNSANDLFTVFEIFYNEITTLEKSLAEEICDFKVISFNKSYKIVHAFASFSNLLIELLQTFWPLWLLKGKDKANPLALILLALGVFLKPLFERIIDDCMKTKFNSIWCMYLERKKKLQLARLFPALTQASPGFEHIAGVKEGGTFILVYDDYPEKDIPEDDDTPDQPEPEDDPCFEPEDIKGKKAQVIYTIDKLQSFPIEQIIGEYDMYNFRTKKQTEYERSVNETEVPLEEVTVEAKEDPVDHALGSFYNDFDSTDIDYSKDLKGICIEPEFKKKQYRVVADFALPYRCCSGCTGVEEIPATRVTIKLDEDQFCWESKAKHLITVSPDGGLMSKNGVIYEDGHYYFVPNKATSEEVEISYTFEGETASRTVYVYNPKADFEIVVREDGDARQTVLNNLSTGADHYEWYADDELISTNKNYVVDDKLFAGRTVKFTLVAFKEKCSDKANKSINIDEPDPVEVILDLPKYEFCKDDEIEHPFTIEPDGGKMKEMDGVIVKSKKFYFVPKKSTKEDIEFTYETEYGTATLYVNVIDVVVTVVERERTDKTVTLECTTSNAETIQWFFGEKLLGTDRKITLKSDDFSDEQITLNVVVKIGECTGTLDYDLALPQPETDVTFRLQGRGETDENIYCDDDQSLYEFTMVPPGGIADIEANGANIIADGGKIKFKPLGHAPGSYDVKYKGQAITVTVIHRAKIDFTWKESKRDGRTVEVAFRPQGELEDTLTWVWGDGKKDADKTPEVITHVFDLTNAKTFTVMLQMKSKAPCQSTAVHTVSFTSQPGVNIPDWSVPVAAEKYNSRIFKTNGPTGGAIDLSTWVTQPENKRLNAYNFEAYDDYFTFSGELQKRSAADPQYNKDLAAGKLNADIAKSYTPSMKATYDAILEANKNNDTSMEKHLTRLYVAQISDLLDVSASQDKDLAKNATLYKALTASARQLKTLKAKGVDINIDNALKADVEKAAGNAGTKKNTEAIIVAVNRLI